MKYKKLQFRMRRLMPLPDAGGNRFDDDSSLAARAAWLHFAGGKTQSEVADRLNIPSTKAHRLIARANREGLIRVFVDGTVAECVALEEALKAGYGLQYCEVAPDLDDGILPLRTLGIVGRATCAASSNIAATKSSASAMGGHWRQRLN